MTISEILEMLWSGPSRLLQNEPLAGFMACLIAIVQTYFVFTRKDDVGWRITSLLVVKYIGLEFFTAVPSIGSIGIRLAFYAFFVVSPWVQQKGAHRIVDLVLGILFVLIRVVYWGGQI